jgi:hypothetical protein
MSLIDSRICFGDSCGFCRRTVDSVLYCGVLVFIRSASGTFGIGLLVECSYFYLDLGVLGGISCNLFVLVHLVLDTFY